MQDIDMYLKVRIQLVCGGIEEFMTTHLESMYRLNPINLAHKPIHAFQEIQKSIWDEPRYAWDDLFHTHIVMLLEANADPLEVKDAYRVNPADYDGLTIKRMHPSIKDIITMR